jgi:hypothetical protein
MPPLPDRLKSEKKQQKLKFNKLLHNRRRQRRRKNPRGLKPKSALRTQNAKTLIASISIQEPC